MKIIKTTITMPERTREQIEDIKNLRGYGSITAIIAEAVRELHTELHKETTS